MRMAKAIRTPNVTPIPVPTVAARGPELGREVTQYSASKLDTDGSQLLSTTKSTPSMLMVGVEVVD